MSFLYMIVVVSVAFMLSFYAIELYRELVARTEEDQVLSFEVKTQQDAWETNILVDYMEMLERISYTTQEQTIVLKQEDIIIYDQPPVRYYHGHPHQLGNLRSSSHVHQQEPGLGP